MGTHTSPITRILWEPLRLPLRTPLRAAHGTTDTRDIALVTVETADGEASHGEATPLPSYAPGSLAEACEAIAAAASAAVGRPVEALWDDEWHGHAGPGAAGAARCALETAAADILSRREGRSLVQWLAAGAGWPAPDGAITVPVQGTIDHEGVADCRDEARRLAGERFHTLKLKLFGRIEQDLERVAAVRGAAPAAALRLDANGAFDFEAAVTFLRRAGQHRIEFVEQPLAVGDGANDATARLQREVPVPLALDESCRSLADVMRISEAGAAEIVVIKPMVSGLREALRMAALARERGLTAVVTTTFDGAIGTMCAMALAAALPQPRPTCGLATAYRIARDIAVGLPPVHEGAIVVEQRPGLGLTLNRDTIGALRSGPPSEVSA